MLRHRDAGEDDALVSAARAGDPSAAYQLYELNEQRGEHHDAKRWLDKAADGGNPDALFRLAQPEDNGDMSKKHLEMMRRAAEAGVADAMFAMGVYFERQFILRKRQGTDDSTQWYRRAADAGHVPAMRTMGRYAAREGRAVEAAGWWRQAEDHRSGDDPDWSWAGGEDVDTTVQGADAGEADALYRFAKLTRITTDDRQTMLRTMGRAREAGSAEASLAYADIVRFLMDGSDHDRQEALDCYHLAVDRGMPEAMVGVGDLGPSEEASGWYQKAADSGCADAVTRLGDLAAGRHANDEAMAYWTKAAEMNSGAAMWRLFNRIQASQGAGETADAWLRRAAEAGDLRAMEALAQNCARNDDQAQAQQWRARLVAERPCLPYTHQNNGLNNWQRQHASDLILDVLNII
jgi:TPR repeat protein